MVASASKNCLTYSLCIDYIPLCAACTGLIIADVVSSHCRYNWKAYLMDWLNYVQWCSMVLILLIIPFRATAHPAQWIVAALAYFAFGLQGFEFLFVSS